MTKASTHSWFNGSIGLLEAGAPSVASINFHLGTGVFDGLMAYWNSDHYYLHECEQHLIRFREGAVRMGLDIPWTVDELRAGIEELLRMEPIGTQYVRPIVYRRAPELWVTGSLGKPVDVCIFTVRVTRDSDEGLSCYVSPIERISSRAIPGHTKVCGAYVNSFTARRTAELDGFQDGIMLDREGRIAEASAANLFVIKDATICTPPLNPDVFPGITRRVVLALAQQLGIECNEKDIMPSQIASIEGAFLCSTLMELRPLSNIGSSELSLGHPIYQAINAAFRKTTHQ
jgi:branched-chain amino acid aminotransferase